MGQRPHICAPNMSKADTSFYQTLDPITEQPVYGNNRCLYETRCINKGDKGDPHTATRNI